MNIVAIVASPNGMNGYTGMLVKPMIEAAQCAKAEIQILSFDTLTVNCCRACTKICHTTGTCFQNDDDFNMILAAMLSADGIIFATPNYCFNVSAQMKGLLDRCNFPLHCGSFRGKYCATVVTSGSSDNDVVEKYLYSILTQFGFRIAGSVNAVQFGSRTRHARGARERGRPLACAWSMLVEAGGVSRAGGGTRKGISRHGISG